MKKQKWYVVAILAVVFGMLGGVAWTAERIMTVSVAFDFVVDGNEMPAGNYEIISNGQNSSNLVLRNSRTGRSTPVSIVTRLADVGRNQAFLAFDKVGDTHYLSEIHIPNRDGYALRGASEEHLHETVPASTE